MSDYKVQIRDAKTSAVVWEAVLEGSTATPREIRKHFDGFARIFLRRETLAPVVALDKVS